MKTFRIMNMILHSWWQGDAISVEEACRAAGWEKGKCWIRERSTTGAGGWKKVKEEVKER